MTSDVAKHRKESAVGELGVIETGLPTKRCAASQDRGGGSTSCSNADKKLGRASLQKCEVVSRTATFGCYKKKKNMMAAATPAVQVKNQVILHPLRVDIPVGSITAILGGAGSGKSTLLKFLAGNMDRNVIVEGKGECIYATTTLHTT
jgi:ATPase subunit of ABC transporter with duplicated ATPase domains